MKLPDFGDLNVVFLTTYGSQLYGTNTSKSDTDLKGVYMPTADQVLMGDVPQTVKFNTKSSAKGEKNTKDDLDCELYSFGYFVKLALSGQTVALEMLWSAGPLDREKFSPLPFNVMRYSPEFDVLVQEREKFLTKNMKAFMGYAKGQAVRYSLKGDKLNTAKKMVSLLSGLVESKGKDVKLGEYFEFLQFNTPNDPNVTWLTDPKGVPMMDVCRRSLQEGVTVQYALKVVQGVVDSYGARSKQAAEHDGADFKALSHAVRITMELHDLYAGKGLTFPLAPDRRKTLLKMKQGDYTVPEIMATLDNWMLNTERKAAESDFPEKTNRKPFDAMVLSVYKNVVLTQYGGR